MTVSGSRLWLRCSALLTLPQYRHGQRRLRYLDRRGERRRAVLGRLSGIATALPPYSASPCVRLRRPSEASLALPAAARTGRGTQPAPYPSTSRNL
jgi:hypothetical protein